MTIALALLLASGLFSETWDSVGRDYRQLPALVLTYGDAGGDGVAAMTGVDVAGAHVLIDESLALQPDDLIRKTAAHEAVHAMLRAQGVPYMDLYEENIANAFAYCWTGIPSIADVPCPAMLGAFR